MATRRAVYGATIAVGAAATALLAQPTPTSIAVGAPAIVAGLALRLAAATRDARAPAPRRGGPFARVRNPGLLGAFLVAAGLVLLAASEGRRGRWVPRALAPLGLLVFFADALPVADAALRERTRASGVPDAERWLSETPALVPRWRAFRPSAAYVAGASDRSGIAREAMVGVGVLALVAVCLARERWKPLLGF